MIDRWLGVVRCFGTTSALQGCQGFWAITFRLIIADGLYYFSSFSAGRFEVTTSQVVRSCTCHPLFSRFRLHRRCCQASGLAASGTAHVIVCMYVCSAQSFCFVAWTGLYMDREKVNRQPCLAACRRKFATMGHQQMRVTFFSETACVCR